MDSGTTGETLGSSEEEQTEIGILAFAIARLADAIERHADALIESAGIDNGIEEPQRDLTGKRF